MSQFNNNPGASESASSGIEVYELVIDLCMDEMQIMLTNMAKVASSFTEWKLSDTDSTHLAKQLTDRKRIIQAAFAFQLEKGFFNFQTTGKALSPIKGSDSQKILQLVGVNSSTEVEELESTLQKLEQLYKNFYQSLIERLQSCVNLNKAKVDENPMHLKFLCEAFQNSIDILDLESKYKLALYRLYLSTTLANLAPIYRKMERSLLDHNILPELKPARFSLRSCTDLSESLPPKSLPDSEYLKLIVLLQKFKEKSRDTTTKYENLFPELKETLLKQQITDFDQPLEQLGLQFKIIFNDEELPSDIKAQLARLQVYFFISAIHEDGFLTRSSHPARRLIDTVVMSEVEYATTDKSHLSGHDVLKDGIDKMVNLQTVNSDSYQDLLTQYKSRLEKTVKEYNKNPYQSGPDDSSKINQLVETMLESMVEPLRAQKKSLKVFEEVWSPLMLEVALTQGLNSPAWHKVVTIIKTHVWALIPKSTEKDRAKMLATLPQIAKSLKGVMKNLKFTDREQKLLLEDLNSEHDDVLEKTSYNIGQATQELKIISTKNRVLESLSRSSKAAGANQKELIKDIDDLFSMIKPDKKLKTSSKPSPSDSKTRPTAQAAKPAVKIREKRNLSPAERIRIGDWVECNQGNKTIMAKLTWKADDCSLHIFVDRNGKRVSEVDLATLNSELKSGQKVLINVDSSGLKRNQSSFLRPLGS